MDSICMQHFDESRHQLAAHCLERLNRNKSAAATAPAQPQPSGVRYLEDDGIDIEAWLRGNK
jgi:hypothetical protein